MSSKEVYDRIAWLILTLGILAGIAFVCLLAWGFVELILWITSK